MFFLDKSFLVDSKMQFVIWFLMTTNNLSEFRNRMKRESSWRRMFTFSTISSLLKIEIMKRSQMLEKQMSWNAVLNRLNVVIWVIKIARKVKKTLANHQFGMPITILCTFHVARGINRFSDAIWYTLYATHLTYLIQIRIYPQEIYFYLLTIWLWENDTFVCTPSVTFSFSPPTRSVSISSWVLSWWWSCIRCYMYYVRLTTKSLILIVSKIKCANLTLRTFFHIWVVSSSFKTHSKLSLF